MDFWLSKFLLKGRKMILECVQCESEFELTAAEERLYEIKGFDIPLRCHDCRRKKRKADQVPLPNSNKNRKRHYYLKYGGNDKHQGLL
jgi:hypothetical protein